MELKNYLICLKTDFDVQNNCIKLPNMIGSFISGATASLVAKNGTKNYLSHLKTDFDVQDV